MQTFKIIVPKFFFSTYAPNVKDWRHKCSGKNGRGNPCAFTDNDMKEIKQGLRRLFKDLDK